MKITEDVLTVLSASRCEGSVVFLPDGQLDRKLYVSVNKVLEALGGKWNRKAKGHVFTDDPATRLDDAIVTGEVDKPADFGFFETPQPLADDVVKIADIRPNYRVLEPSAGRGRIALAALAVAPSIVLHVVELQTQHVIALRQVLPSANTRVWEQDFLKFKGCDFDCVVMNPPFAKGADVDHVTHAHKMLRKGGRLVAIMSAGVEFRQDKRTESFRALVEEHDGTIERLPDGSFKESGTMVNTVMVVMEA